jgi:SprB repeat
LTIGCGSNTLSLSSTSDVADFLPSGSTPRALNAGNLNNPGQSYSNVLAAQLVGITLAVGFDGYDPNFSTNSINFSDLIINQGSFAGSTVAQFLSIANQAIGGCVTGYSFSDLNETATAINENYDNGTSNNGFLICNPFRIYAITVDANVTCYGASNGQVRITIDGGNAPYIYSLSSGQTSGFVASTSHTFSGLVAGTYTVSVVDSNGLNATDTTSFNITQPTQLVVTTSNTNVSCYGGNNGSATVTSISGGVAPYTVLWSNGAITNTLTGLAVGVYSGTITDILGCQMLFSATVSQPTQLVTSVTTTNVNCFGGNDGSATVIATGGTAPYTILWDDSSTNFT